MAQDLVSLAATRHDARMTQVPSATMHTALLALELAAGPALLLDANFDVLMASPAAEALLGQAVPQGTSAPALLCGDKKKRPIADALAEGRAVEAIIPHANDEDRLLKVRSLPIVRGDKNTPWLLLLEDAGHITAGEVVYFGMRTVDSAMKQLFMLIERIAAEDATILVRGESGSGKELVAQAIHAASPRKHAPFCAINCAALPPTLLEAELFGAVKGSFTGAIKDTPGLIRSAHKGTLFLDEVAELPLELQAKLLRVLETKEVLPVGGTSPIPVDVRWVSATHRSLRHEVEAGRFRADLMYRLRVIPLFLPPLRDRPGDVAALARAFVADNNERSKRRRVEAISPEALHVLQAWSWPGNVRELKNAVQYACILGDGPILRSSELPTELLSETRAPTPPTPTTTQAQARSVVDDSLFVPTREALAQQLARAGGKRDLVAKHYGVSRVTLWRWMSEYGLSRTRRRRAPSTTP